MDSNSPVIQSEKLSASIELAVEKGSAKRLNFVSILLVLVGLTLIIGAGFNDYFRDIEGNLSGKYCLALAAGVAAVLNGFLINTEWKKFAFWTGLILIGQSASLQMIDAGRLIHFQHYRTLPELLNTNLLPLLLILTQFVFVSISIFPRVSTITNWLTKNFTWWQLLVISLFTFLAGAAVTKDISIYLTSLLIAAFVQLINLANIILIAWAIPNDSIKWLREKLENFFSEPKENTSFGLDRFAVFSALWVILIAGLLSYFVYQNHPHVPDESIYLFQAKYMAAGQITAQAPKVPEAFSVYMIPTQEERWFSIFPPAWSALLAIGLKLDLEWLVNPLLAGICILLSYIFFRDIYSRRFARMGTLLLCCSPWFIFMAMSFMSHIFTLVCALLAAVLLNRAFQKTRIFYALGAGLTVGVLSLIRPFDGVLIAGLLGVWTLIKCQTWKTKILTSAALIIGTIASASIVFPYNKSITGNSFLLPMDAYYTKYFWKNANSLGFGSDRGMGWDLDAFPGHSPLEAIINAALNTFSINLELFGWGFGSLLIVICLILSGNLQKKDGWAIAAILAVIVGYSFFWYHGGPDFGARYWFLIIIPLIALTVRGIEWLSEKITNQETDKKQLNIRVVIAFATLCTVSLICYFPWRSVDKYFHYLGMRPDIRQLSKENNFGKSLVLIRGNEHPDYESAWVYNPLNFEGDEPIYAWDKNSQIRKELLKTYSDRKVWVIDGPTTTNNSYKIFRGPIETDELSKEEAQLEP